MPGSTITRGQGMAFVEMNPGYRDFLEQHGLVSPEDFLALPAVIICGHPDRNVARVTLGAGTSALSAFLKREHRVRWKDRLQSAAHGFGLVSRSYREAVALRMLGPPSIRCPPSLAG